MAYDEDDFETIGAAFAAETGLERVGPVGRVGRRERGRMGFVTGEDATEVANPPTNCSQQCQAQNRVRGRLANLGFPFPVPAGSRF